MLNGRGNEDGKKIIKSNFQKNTFGTFLCGYFSQLQCRCFARLKGETF